MFTRNRTEELTACILIPARGGSKRIKNKNLQLIDDKPLIAWPIAEAAQLDVPVYVSTDSTEIAKRAVGANPAVTILERPPELSQDDTSTWDVLEHHKYELPYDLIAIRQCTSPFVGADILDAAFRIAAQTGFCIGSCSHELGRKSLHKAGLWVISNRYDTRQTLSNAGNWLFLSIDSMGAVDIDTERDLMEARELWAKHRI